jgi:hypothetical protein
MLIRNILLIVLSLIILSSCGNNTRTEIPAQTVLVKGYGDTIEAARLNAGKIAIEEVVGSYVVSETIVKNRKLITDGILSYSNGYIKSFIEKEVGKEDGIYVVEVYVDVAKNKVRKALGNLNIPYKVGSTEFKVKGLVDFSNIDKFSALFNKVVVEPILFNKGVYDLQILSLSHLENEAEGKDRDGKTIKYRFKNRQHREMYENGALLPYMIQFKASLSDEYINSVEQLLSSTANKKEASGCVKNQKYNINYNNGASICLSKYKPNFNRKYTKYSGDAYIFSPVIHRLINNKTKKIRNLNAIFEFKFINKNGQNIGTLKGSEKRHIGQYSDFSSSDILEESHYMFFNKRSLWNSHRNRYPISGIINNYRDPFSLLTNNQIFGIVVLLPQYVIANVDRVKMEIKHK